MSLWLCVLVSQLAPVGTASTAAGEADVFPGGPRLDEAPAPEASAPSSPAPIESPQPAPPAAPAAPAEPQPRAPPPPTPVDPPADELPVAEPISLYRNPAGKFQLSGSAGFGVVSLGRTSPVGGPSSRFVIGVGLGYGVLTGVLPGLRATVGFGRDFAAELVGTLTLTPPVAWTVTPFALGEFGSRWQGGFHGWLYGGGAGVYLGRPASTVSVQVGYMFRRWALPGGTVDLSWPLVIISTQF